MTRLRRRSIYICGICALFLVLHYAYRTPDLLGNMVTTYSREMHMLSSINIDEIFTTRRERTHSVCNTNASLYKQMDSAIDYIKNRQLLYSQSKNLVYCMVEKVGCTLWRRIFYIFSHQNKQEPTINPFSLNHYFVHNHRIPTLKGLSRNTTRNVLSNASTIMFVRDPYERMFSGYVDKLVSVNPYYWSTFGTNAISRTRPALKGNRHGTCGHNLTFSEFVKYLVMLDKNGYPIDIHFSTIYKHCRPCEVQYDYIGRMETFDRDVLFLSNKLKFFGNATLRLTKNSTMVDNIKLIVSDSLKHKDDFTKCFTPGEYLQRVWTTLKLRGLVPPDTMMPNMHGNVTVNRFVTAAVSVSDPSKINQYKRHQMIKLYKTVPKPLLEEFRKFLLADCTLFDYDDRPSYLFN